MDQKLQDLIRQRAQAEREKEADAQKYKTERLKWWQSTVRDLLVHTIRTWLGTLAEDGTIDFKTPYVTVAEEWFGSYQIHSAVMTLGKSTLKLIPVGSQIMGSFGRIDVVGPEAGLSFGLAPMTSKRETMLLLQVQNPTPESGYKPTGAVWYIVRKEGQRRDELELTEASFGELLAEVLGIQG
jgi:hypothetical protein